MADYALPPASTLETSPTNEKNLLHAGHNPSHHAPRLSTSSSHTPTPTTDLIKSSAAQNTDLLLTLNRTLPAAQNIQSAILATRAISKELRRQEADVTCLRKRRDDAEKKARRSRSSPRRAVYAAICQSEKCDAEAEELEEARSAAEVKLHAAQDRRDGLSQQLADQQTKKEEALEEATAHGEAHVQLDSLYDYVFKADTGLDFPEQERLRREHAGREAELKRAKEALESSAHGDDEEFLDVTVRRQRTLKEQIKRAARAAEDVRLELELERGRCFEAVVGFGFAPPSYSDCCNRVDIEEIRAGSDDED